MVSVPPITLLRIAMSPLSLLIDHSQLLGRVEALYSFAPDAQTPAADESVTVQTSERRDERAAQLKSLVVGTLLFMPFLIGYFVACANS
jgi:hypothetical protein